MNEIDELAYKLHQQVFGPDPIFGHEFNTPECGGVRYFRKLAESQLKED